LHEALVPAAPPLQLDLPLQLALPALAEAAGSGVPAAGAGVPPPQPTNMPTMIPEAAVAASVFPNFMTFVLL